VREADVLRVQIDRLRTQEAAVLGQAAERADALLQDTLQRAMALRQAARADPSQRGKALEGIQQLRRETRQRVPAPPKRPGPAPIAAGAVVRVDAYGAEGPVIEVRGDQLVVQLGLLKVEAARHEVTLVRPSTAAKRTLAPVAPGAGFDRELNVRGERVEDALERVRDLVREAHALRIESVRVLHGKGTGALRDAVRRYLKDERLVERFEDAVPYEGGFGVTVAYLRLG